MKEIRYLDRTTRQERREQIYGEVYIKALYGDSWLAWFLSKWFLPIVTQIAFFSHLYGVFQKSRFSRRKIGKFIQVYQVDTSEFLEPIDSYRSFNDFFIRKLKSGARPIVPGHDIAILPADGRYLAYENIADSLGFTVKGKKFCLESLLQDPKLAKHYASGSILIGRLAPVDYHRFHFPVSCLPGPAKEISGHLYSVNPIALKKRVSILCENKRVITPLKTKQFGTVLFIEVGATYVGSIHQTYLPDEPYAKGDEKGYFSFGGSCVIVLFEPGAIVFDRDLVDASQRGIEVFAKMGTSLGRSLKT